MSVVLSYVSDLISLIAADTRVIYGHSMESTSAYDDNNKNLYNTSIGWCAGTGLYSFVESIKIDLQKNRVNNVYDILSIYHKTKDKMYNSKEKELNISTIVVSYIEDNLHQNLDLRIASLSRNSVKDNCFSIINKNQIYIAYPYDYMVNDTLKSELLNKFDLKYNFGDNLTELLKKILNIFRHISDNSHSVSKICDIGLMVTLKDGIYKIRYNGEINEFIKNLNEGDLDKNMVQVAKFRSISF